ncbi:MAG: hypothetical protein ACPGR2_16695 [Psychrobium sp.]
MKKFLEYALWLAILLALGYVVYQWRWLEISEPTAIYPVESNSNKASAHQHQLPNIQRQIIADIESSTQALSRNKTAPLHSSISNSKHSVALRQLSGVLSFDRLTFQESHEDDIVTYQFNPDAPIQQPLRFIRLNVRDSQHNIIARTTTDEMGRYQVEIADAGQQYYLEAVSQMVFSDNHNHEVITQVVNQGNAYPERTTYRRLYHATSELFVLTDSENTQNLNLHTGWHHTLREFEPMHSQAQPFAILDTLAKGFLYLKQHDIEITPKEQMLTVTWSQDPDIVEQSTGYYSPYYNLIYISGNNALDTNQKPISTISEWNEHTILHEFGHYYMRQLARRDDTQAGHHTAFGFGSLTLAFSEGVATALAKTILENWHYKRVSFDPDKQRFAINTKAIIHQDKTERIRKLATNDGEIYQRPAFDFSPFIEQTVTYFVLSIIDPNSPYSLRTTQLSHEIGFSGFHRAMLQLKDSAALTTIYNLAHQLKTDSPLQSQNIDDLGLQLDLVFNDEWGSDQLPLTAHIIGYNGQLLPEQAQYPLYQELSLDKANEIYFNGALESISKMRPGTLRYLKFKAPYDGIIDMFIADTQSQGQTHKFSFNIVNQGKVVAHSSYYEQYDAHALAWDVRGGKTYVIRVFDEAFTHDEATADHLITTKITANYRR